MFLARCQWDRKQRVKTFNLLTFHIFVQNMTHYKCQLPCANKEHNMLDGRCALLPACQSNDVTPPQPQTPTASANATHTWLVRQLDGTRQGCGVGGFSGLRATPTRMLFSWAASRFVTCVKMRFRQCGFLWCMMHLTITLVLNRAISKPVYQHPK